MSFKDFFCPSSPGKSPVFLKKYVQAITLRGSVTHNYGIQEAGVSESVGEDHEVDLDLLKPVFPPLKKEKLADGTEVN